MERLMGVLVVIPIAILLTISFFVLLAISKAQTQGIKVFGRVVAPLLWVSAAFVFMGGIYHLATGKCLMMSVCKEMQGQTMDAGRMPITGKRLEGAVSGGRTQYMRPVNKTQRQAPVPVQ